MGLTEACNKVTGVLDMRTAELVDEPMPELFIADDDRYRIFQVSEGKKLWLTYPAPVIKKNGVVITESTDGFEIDYLGGSIVFDTNKRLLASDVITVSATQIIGDSKVVNELKNKTAQYKGAFATADDLNAEVPTGNGGDYAVVVSENSFYLWNVAEGGWVTSKSEIKPQGETEDSDWYYYGGRNTWQDLKARVLGAVLADLDTSDTEKIQATDTIIQAFGKLQAQINDGALDLQGDGAPTTETAAKIGRDYLDITTGNKYHLVEIDFSEGTQKYIWEQYADVSKLPKFDTEPIEESTNGITSGGVYAALQAAETAADDKYMAMNNPIGTGAFSMNRKADTEIGEYSHAGGYNCIAAGKYSHAEGYDAEATGDYSHAEGSNTWAKKKYCHSEGFYTRAGGNLAHAEGYSTAADGEQSHAEGWLTKATGDTSHAEGYSCTAAGAMSHAEGQSTSARGRCSHAQGRYNIPDDNEQLAHIVGNGDNNAGRSNAHTLGWDGTAWFQGDVYVGSTSGTNMDDGSEKLAKVSELPSAITDLSGILPVSQGGTGATTAQQARSNLNAQAQHKAITVTLSSGVTSWSVTATGVTTTNTVVVCPTDSSKQAYVKAGVTCTAQGTDILTFTATTATTEVLTVNVLILD